MYHSFSKILGPSTGLQSQSFLNNIVCFSKISRTLCASRILWKIGVFLQCTPKRKITVCSHKHSFIPYPSLSPYRRTERQTETEYTHYAWPGGTLFPVVLLCPFLVLVGNRFWFYILYICTQSTIQLWCCVSFFNLAGNSFWCYVRT